MNWYQLKFKNMHCEIHLCPMEYLLIAPVTTLPEFDKRLLDVRKVKEFHGHFFVADQLK